VQTMLVMSTAFLPLFLGSNPESFEFFFFASQMQYLFAKSSDKSAVLIALGFFYYLYLNLPRQYTSWFSRWVYLMDFSLEGKEEDYALKSTCKYKRNIKS
jgi:hypothetical protein